MTTIKRFFISGKMAFIRFILGGILGSIHWYFWGCYWGFYPLSSEWWVNCIYGGIFTNLFVVLYYDAIGKSPR